MKHSLLLVSLVLLVATVGCERPLTEPKPLYVTIQVGQELQLNVQSESACADPIYHTGRVAAITERAVVVHDVNNPPGSFTDAEYHAIGMTFDTLVYRTAVPNFGEPADLNGNGRAIIFYTRAVNQLTDPGEEAYVGGFFYARDLFPKRRTARFQACPGSNYAEMFYMLAPDPQGQINGNVRTKSMVQNTTIGVLAHEFQHMINASRRLHVRKLAGEAWNEEIWLNEGLSHIAEELIGHRVGRLAPRQNITWPRLTGDPAHSAFTRYYSANFVRLQMYLADPEAASAIGSDFLATRGAIWQFLRYAADRKGGTQSRTWKGLATSEFSGLANLRTVLGVEPLEWMLDWLVSIYTDDAVPKITAPHQQPSWNFRSIYPAMRDPSGRSYGGYPLKTVALENGRSIALNLKGGSGAFLRFGVAAGKRGEIRVDDSGASCPDEGSGLSLDVAQVLKVEAHEAGLICLEGGSQGAEFTYIPFFASEVGTAQLALNVTGRGIIPTAGLPSSSITPTTGMPALAAAGEPHLPPAQAWERRLRQREAVQLTSLVGGNGAERPEGPSYSVAATSANGTVDPRLRIAIVRTR